MPTGSSGQRVLQGHGYRVSEAGEANVPIHIICIASHPPDFHKVCGIPGRRSKPKGRALAWAGMEHAWVGKAPSKLWPIAAGLPGSAEGSESYCCKWRRSDLSGP